MDEDGSGTIQSDELAGALARLGYHVPSRRCLELYASIDSNGDGVVSLREFAAFFRFASLEARLRAEGDAAEAKAGTEKHLDLREKLGMVVRAPASAPPLPLPPPPLPLAHSARRTHPSQATSPPPPTD